MPKNLRRHWRRSVSREEGKKKVLFPLTSNVLCDHNVVANNLLLPLDTSSDGFWMVLTIILFHVQDCYVLPCR